MSLALLLLYKQLSNLASQKLWDLDWLQGIAYAEVGGMSQYNTSIK